ncbi:ATP-dependent zinc metalloprotease FTSH 4, mitochondrial [Chytridiales sp. JEL 0842]|nr:ATP-dependent zinc metalloprotease FTSH 4, mitochondrial [Chytridiales sp. JEL 0842]
MPPINWLKRSTSVLEETQVSEPITIFYTVSPHLNNIFTFKTLSKVRQNRLHHQRESEGLVHVAKDIVRTARLPVHEDSINSRTIFRAPLVLIDPINDGEPNPYLPIGKHLDKYTPGKNMIMSEKGDDFFDLGTEVLIFFPEFLKTAVGPSPAFVGPPATSAPGGAVGGGGGGGGGGGRPNSKIPEEHTGPPFDAVKYDQGEFRKKLEERIYDEWQRLQDSDDPNAALFKQVICDVFMPWALEGYSRRPSGILLYGPPGNGKSFFVTEYLMKLGLELTGDNYASSRFSGGEVGEGEAKMRAESSICKLDRTKLYLMFIDEIDTVGGDRNRKENEGYKIDYLNQLLAIVGQKNYRNLIVVGATNFKEKMDEALIRDGRLEYHYLLPSLTARRRELHFCNKLAKALTYLLNQHLIDNPDNSKAIEIAKKKKDWKLKITNKDVERLLLSDKALHSYLQRNTVNFTFANFDRLCSDIEGTLRLFFRVRILPIASLFLDHLPKLKALATGTTAIEATDEEKNVYTNEQLFAVARDRMISECMNATVFNGVKEYLKNSTAANLKYNRMAWTESGTTSVIDEFLMSMKLFLKEQNSYQSIVSVPTGRFMINLKPSNSPYPEFNVELAKNDVISSFRNFDQMKFQYKATFFHDRLMPKLLAPLIQVRKYETITIIDREAVQFDEEDKLFDTLKSKYEESIALAKLGSGCLIVIDLADILGLVTTISTQKRITTTESSNTESVSAKENVNKQSEGSMRENTQSETNEEQVRNAFESSLRNSLSNTQNTMESYENKLEFSNDLVKNRSEKITLTEKEASYQEQSERENMQVQERRAEMETYLDRAMQKFFQEKSSKESYSRTDRTELTETEMMEQTRQQTREKREEERYTETSSLDKSHIESTEKGWTKETGRNWSETATDYKEFSMRKEESQVKEKIEAQRKAISDRITDSDQRTSETRSEKNQRVEDRVSSGTNQKQIREVSDTKSDAFSTTERFTKSQEERAQRDDVQSSIQNTTNSNTSRSEQTRRTEDLSKSDNISESRSSQGTTHTQNQNFNTDNTQTNSTAHVLSDNRVTSESQNRTNQESSTQSENHQETRSSEHRRANDFTQQRGDQLVSDGKKERRNPNANTDSNATENRQSTTDETRTEERVSKIDSTQRQDIQETTRRNEHLERDTRSTEQYQTKDHTEVQSTSNSQIESTQKQWRKEHSEETTKTSERVEKEIQNETKSNVTGNRMEQRREDFVRETDRESQNTKDEVVTRTSEQLQKTQQMSNTYNESERQTRSEQMLRSQQEQHMMSEDFTESISESVEQSKDTKSEIELTNTQRREVEQMVRSTLEKDKSQVQEEGMNEEERRRQNEMITNKVDLMQEMKNSGEESQTQSNEKKWIGSQQSNLKQTSSNDREKVDRTTQQTSTSLRKDVVDEITIGDQVLRPKFIDVIARFAGISSRFLNNFQLINGADLVFIVENDKLAQMIQLAIQWGQMKPKQPQDSISVPDFFFGMSEGELKPYWVEVIETCKLEKMKIVLSPPSNASTRFFDNAKNVILMKNPKGKMLAKNVKLFEIEGYISGGRLTNSLWNDHIDIINMFTNLTTLNLTAIKMDSLLEKGLPTDGRIKHLKMDMCQLYLFNQRSYSLGLVDKYFRGRETSGEKSLPVLHKLESLSIRKPENKLERRDPRTQTVVTVSWDITYDCHSLFQNITKLDLSFHDITWNAFKALFQRIQLPVPPRQFQPPPRGNSSVGILRPNDRGSSLARQAAATPVEQYVGGYFGRKLVHLVLDGCKVSDIQDGELDKFVQLLPEKLMPRGANSVGDGWFVEEGPDEDEKEKEEEESKVVKRLYFNRNNLFPSTVFALAGYCANIISSKTGLDLVMQGN